MVFAFPVFLLRDRILEVEAHDSCCQDKLTHLIFSSSHPEGTSSPEKRGHSDADAAKLQLDAHHPVLVGSELGERRLRPLPMTLRPTSGSSSLSRLCCQPSWVWAEVVSAGLCKKRIRSVPFRRRGFDPDPDFLPVCTGTTEDSAPSDILKLLCP